MNYKVSIRLDLYQDAWNWWHAANHSSHGVDWSDRLTKPELRKIIGLDQKEAMAILEPYLKSFYEKNQNLLQEQLKTGQSLFDEYGQAAMDKMVKIIGRPLYRDEFVGFLTTFPRCPYNYQAGYFWLCTIWPAKCYLGIFLHELLHFQFLFYYQQKLLPIVGPDKLDRLKEALTVILNYDFRDYLCQDDQGYEIDQILRQQLADYWQKNKDFDAVIDYGVAILNN